MLTGYYSSFETKFASAKKWAFFAAFLLMAAGHVLAQTCPPNIDFEDGDFSGWTCYTGTTGHLGGENVISLYGGGPVDGRHTLYKRSANPELDPYGGFPVICPNGSGYSIKLGNNLAGTEAEGVSYEFTIPANRNEYTLIYHYAVVFQDPAHRPYEQPRMVTEIMNLTDNSLISCSSFTFYPVGSALPGFFQSQNPGTNTPVWCKDWTAVSVNLDGLAGKRIRLFFKTADCTFRRHFGYAYVDVNSECSGEFTGASFCPGDTAVKVLAPFGYQTYNWYDANGNTVSKDQALVLQPAPRAGTTMAVELTPYHGYGCVDTLYAKLVDTLTVKANAGADVGICYGTPAQLGVTPVPGILYSWSPSAGLTDPATANPFANPLDETSYVLTTRSYGGGCVNHDTVMVTPVNIDTSLALLGKASFCEGSGESAWLQTTAADSIQWYRDNLSINGANQVLCPATQSGQYYAVLHQDGCTAATRQQSILVEKPRKGIQYPVLYALEGNPVSLQARNFGMEVLWQPAANLNSASLINPVFDGNREQSYTIQINTAAGCVTVDTQVVKIVKSIDILVPTAFTPNGDGRNDLLRPFLYGIRELSFFRVYNRWGQLVFQTSRPEAGWDGLIGGKKAANEAVVWVAEGIGVDGKRYLRKGTAVCVQ